MCGRNQLNSVLCGIELTSRCVNEKVDGVIEQKVVGNKTKE